MKMILLLFLISLQTETRLGDSPYYIQLPDYLNVTEAKGKEGQRGYSFVPKDSSLRSFGFIEIEHGRPVPGSEFDYDGKKEYINANFLGQQVKWTITYIALDDLIAKTGVTGIKAEVRAKNRKEIDNMITIFSTLTKK